MDFIWPPRSCSETYITIPRTSFMDGCKRRSSSDQIAKVQPLTANVVCPSFGNVRNVDTFAKLRQTHFVGDKLSHPLLGDVRKESLRSNRRAAEPAVA
jgi:hypothetical protein